MKVPIKQNVPETIRWATWLVLTIAFLWVAYSIWNDVVVVGLFNQFLLNPNEAKHIHSHTISHAIHFIIFIILAFFLFHGLRKAKRGIYILTILFTAIGMIPWIIGLCITSYAAITFLKLLADQTPLFIQEFSFKIKAILIISTTGMLIQLSLMTILLIILFRKKSRAWFKK